MPDQSSSSHSKDFFIVGIGASAGGVQALESFFANVPDDPNAAFVVIQHLSPNHKSMMTEILQRRTKMVVQEAEDQMLLEPSKVYVLPPRKNLTISNRCIHLQDKSESFDYPINRFFQSLVKGWNEHIIAILLSGTGKDGTEGLQAVSRAGGVALVQSPETAEFISMPTSAIPSGLVDEVLSPQDLARTVFEIIRFSENFPDASADQASLIDPDQLQTILDILAERKEIDFSHYKVSTLSRRIHHRCTLTRQGSLSQYIRLLKRSDEEQKLLFQDLLIGATAFFRDPQAWEYLENRVLPPLIAGLEPNQQFRVWVSACATGEEAYSMAILVDEALQKADKSVQAKIFATDLDSSSLETAAQGIYSESIAKDISPERLERYFNYEDGQYRVKRTLREMLIIAPHDLTKNAGFSKMNMVSCRNVLIYMQPQLQQQVLRLLHFALATEGVLFLGSSESLGNLESEFEDLSSKWKIFRKRQNAQLSMLPITRQSVATPIRIQSRTKSRQNQTNRLVEEAFKHCLVDRQITCLLVNPENQLVRIFYNVAQLLEFSVGDAVLDITEIIHPALRLPLSTALHRAKRDQETVLYSGIKIEHQGAERSVSLRVGLDKTHPTASTEYLIVVLEIEQQPVDATDMARRFDADGEAAQQITELEYELQQTRENLQVTIEELETTNEEQQATNEELLASNEELQSTNEELQSVNEELYTVNAEYQSKIQELTQLNNDIDNLLRSTEIGVIFLDKALNIRKFTPAATQTINIKPSDTGRPLADLTNNLDCPDLFDTIESVLATFQPVEKEVKLVNSGNYLLMRVNPYLRDTDNDYDGVVLTFIDINELKQAQNRLWQANSSLENLYAASPVGLCLLDSQLRFSRINQTLANINGTSVEENIGKPMAEMLPELFESLEHYLYQILDTGQVINQVEIRRAIPETPDQQRVWLASCYPVDFIEDERGIGAVVVEVTERVQTEAALRDSQAKLQEAQRLAKLGNWEVDLTTLEDIHRAVADWSPELYQITGLDPSQAPPSQADILEYYHPDDREALHQAYSALAQEGIPYELDVRFYRPDGEMRYFNVLGEAVRNDQGELAKLYGAVMDITERKSIEARLKRQNRALEEAMAVAQAADSANQAKSEFLSNMSHEIRTPLNAIMGAGQLLMRSNPSQQQQQLLNMLKKNGELLLRLIEDILDLSRLESRQLRFEARDFSLPELIQDLKNTFEPQAEAKGLSIDFAIENDVPKILVGDELRFQQVLNNLISNAIKFTDEGAIRTSISLSNGGIREDQTAEKIVLYCSVQDTGVGLGPDQVEDIFYPFIQADGSITRQYGGTGLGLAICRRIIELLGGRIGVDSELELGSTFWFELPMQVSELDQASIPDVPTSSADDVSTPTPTEASLRVLVVEDREDNRDLLVLMLRSIDCQVEIAEDGQQALETLSKRSFDIVLMDCQMPVLDGYETTRRLRQQEGDQQHTVVIGVTAHAMTHDRNRCLEAGMDDYISKPINLQQLLDLIEAWSTQLS